MTRGSPRRAICSECGASVPVFESGRVPHSCRGAIIPHDCAIAEYERTNYARAVERVEAQIIGEIARAELARLSGVDDGD